MEGIGDRKASIQEGLMTDCDEKASEHDESVL